MFDRLKSLFIVEDEGPKKSSKAYQPQAEEQKGTPPAKSQQKTRSTRPVAGGKVTSKFTNILFGAMEKNDQEGFDYLEFKQSLQNLAKMPMDEATRFKSAFAMAQTMGVTPDLLVKSAEFYIQVLDGEKNLFPDCGSATVPKETRFPGEVEERHGVSRPFSTFKSRRDPLVVSEGDEGVVAGGTRDRAVDGEDGVEEKPLSQINTFLEQGVVER